jgi:hypothetical protein
MSCLTSADMGSGNFLVSYCETLSGIRKEGNPIDNNKGKSLMDDGLHMEGRKKELQTEDRRRKVRWKPPQMGWVKLNLDMSFCMDKGITSMGVIVRG